MKNLLAAILFAAMSFGMPAAVVVKNPSQRKQLIDDGWQFRLTADDKGTPACGEWRNLDLPHDWSVEADFDSLAAAGNDGSCLPAGKGCAPTGQCLSSTIRTWPMWQPKSWTAKGAWCPMPDAFRRISFAAKGACGIIAIGSADIEDIEGYTWHERNAWRGRAMAVVKSGTTVLTATAPGSY